MFSSKIGNKNLGKKKNSKVKSNELARGKPLNGGGESTKNLKEERELNEEADSDRKEHIKDSGKRENERTDINVKKGVGENTVRVENEMEDRKNEDGFAEKTGEDEKKKKKNKNVDVEGRNDKDLENSSDRKVNSVASAVGEQSRLDINTTSKNEKIKLEDTELKESGLTSDGPSKILTIEGIREFLSFTFLSRNIGSDFDVSTFCSLQEIGITMPPVISKIKEAEILIDHSALDGWVLAIPRLRNFEWMSTSEYEDYLDGIVSGCRSILIEFFRIFQDFKVYTTREFQHFNPSDVGLKLLSSSLDNDTMFRVFQKYYEILFERQGKHTRKTYEIRIFLNPVLHEFQRSTQSFFYSYMTSGRFGVDSGWMLKFLEKKKIIVSDRGNIFPILAGEKIYLPSGSPMSLPECFQCLPYINRVLLNFSAVFCFPTIHMSTSYSQNLASIMNTNVNQVTGLGNYMSLSITSAAEDDIKKIFLSIIHPCQVILNVNFQNNVTAVINFLAAIAAKMFLPNGPGMVTLTNESLMNIDYAIENFLVKNTYVANNNSTLELLIRGNPSKWNILKYADQQSSNQGCVNYKYDNWKRIDKPLYPGVIEMPCYGGMTNYKDIQPEEFENSKPTEFFTCFQAAIEEMPKRGVGSQLSTLFSFYSPPYRAYLYKLNRFLTFFYENGFQLTKERKDLLFSLATSAERDQVNHFERTRRTPMDEVVVLDISAESLLCLLKFMPDNFAPPESILEEPRIESVISSEIQQFFAIFDVLCKQVNLDRAGGFARKKLVKKAMKYMSEDSVIRRLLEYALKSVYY